MLSVTHIISLSILKIQIRLDNRQHIDISHVNSTLNVSRKRKRTRLSAVIEFSLSSNY